MRRFIAEKRIWLLKLEIRRPDRYNVRRGMVQTIVPLSQGWGKYGK